MSKQLTINEVESLVEEDLTLEQKNRLKEINITFEQFSREFQDVATLSGLEDDVEFMSVDDFIEHLNVMMYSDTDSIGSTELVVAESKNELITDSFKITNTMAKPDIITNIKDKKQIFNLGKHVDKMLNDCENKIITIDKILIKKYTKPLDVPVVDPTTGEILQDTKTSMSVVIVDKDGTSYATGSKTFGYQLINCIYEFGDEMDGLQIKIIKTQKAGAKNKSLDFELV